METESPQSAEPPAPDLAAIRARCEAATPGPWKAEHTELHADALPLDYRMRWGGMSEVGRPEDAEFIANAREDIPALLTALEAAQAEIATLRARIPNVEEATVLRSRVKQIVDNTLTLESDIRRLYALVVARQKGPADE